MQTIIITDTSETDAKFIEEYAKKKKDGIITDRSLQRFIDFDEPQHRLFALGLNPNIAKLVNLNGPYMYHDVTITKSFTIENDIIKNVDFKGVVYEKEKNKFSDSNFRQPPLTSDVKATLMIGFTKEIGLTNYKILTLAHTEPGCKTTFHLVLREMHKTLLSFPHLFEDFRKENIIIPMKSQHKIKGVYHVPILSFSQKLKPYWRTEPITSVSQDGYVALLKRFE